MKKTGKKRCFIDLHQPAVAAVKDVVKAGFLMKEGGSYKSWKQRWFVVDGASRTMYYYSKQKDKKPLGFIPLWDCKVEPNVERAFQNCFEVSHPDRRTFFMITSSPKELNEWVDALRKVVRDGTRARKAKATAFWEGAFGEETSVKWPRFCAALKEHVGDNFDRATEDKVHFVLATLALKSQPKDEMHLGQLHLFTELLGPINVAYRNLGEICLWYHGALTSSDAESKLADQPEGTFLLRLRRFAADSGLLALSLVGKKGITHTNIYKEPIADVYYTGFTEPIYSTVQELIRAHSGCFKECESLVARDFFKQFEAARQAAASAPAAPVAVPDNNGWNGKLAAPENDVDVVSPRVPIDGPGKSVHGTRGVDDAVDTFPTPPEARKKQGAGGGAAAVAGGGASGGDGPPIVAAQSGVTTFESMHKPSARDVPDVILSGHLLRETDDDEQKRSFFVLSGMLKTLYYFDGENDPEPSGFVPLWGCDISETQDAAAEGCFEISHPDRKSFFLQAKDEAQMNDWANALLTVIDEWKSEQSRKRERFWREHFGTRKEVSWATFLESLQDEVGQLTRRQEVQLRFMVGTFAAKNQSPDTIKSRQLFLFVELFGSLATCYKQMDRVCLWYQGSLTSSDAQARLEDQQEGTFLIRLRRFAADSGLLALSFVENGQPQHVNIFRDPLSDCYYLQPDEPIYANIQELLEGHSDLHALPPPGLGRAFREFMEKSGDVADWDDGPRQAPPDVALVLLSREQVLDGEDEGNSHDSADEAELRNEKLRIEQEEQEELRRREQEELEEHQRREQEEEQLRRQQEEDELEEHRRLQQEQLEEEQRRQEEEERYQQQLREERDCEELRRRREAEAEQARQTAAVEAAALKKRRQEDERRAEEAKRQEQERKQQEEERERKRRAEERAKQAEAERARRAEQERLEAERLRKIEQEKAEIEEERRRLAALEQKRRKAEEEARRKQEEDARQQEQQRAAAEEQRRAEAERKRAELQREEERRRKEEEKRREAERVAEERRRAFSEEERRRAERLDAERQAAQPQAKTDQQRKVEQQKALIELERKKLEEERQAKLARLARERNATAQTKRESLPPAKRLPVVATPQFASVIEPELEDPVDYSTAAADQFPAFNKDTKVERLYKERMLQARQEVASPPKKPPTVTAAAGAAPRQSNVIKVDVQQVKEILTYLSNLEEQEALTDDEVYQLENLVTVQKDQMVLSYYMTFKDNPDVFVKRCRRHLQSLAKAGQSLNNSIIE